MTENQTFKGHFYLKKAYTETISSTLHSSVKYKIGIVHLAYPKLPLSRQGRSRVSRDSLDERG
jgi:hypothetical protein